MYYCTVLSLYEDTTLQERDKALQEVEQSKNKQDTMETAVEKLKKDLEISKREKEKLSSSLSDLESYRENMLAKVREYYCSYYSYRQEIYGLGGGVGVGQNSFEGGNITGLPSTCINR